MEKKNDKKAKGKDNFKGKATVKIPMTTKVNSKALNMPPKVIIEEKIKVFLAVILFLLFAVLFISVVWYFLSQVDSTLVNGTAAVKTIFPIFR